MGKVIPFQNKHQAIETLTKSLLSKIREGKFSSASSYSKGIIRYLETASVDDINVFLMSIAPIVEALDWKYHASSTPTPDDIGYSKNDPKAKKSRARENVIFELGLFIGMLDRPNVAVLYKKGVEVPTDLDGIARICFDEAEGWKLQLAKEVKEIFKFVNLNNIK